MKSFYFRLLSFVALSLTIAGGFHFTGMASAEPPPPPTQAVTFMMQDVVASTGTTSVNIPIMINPDAGEVLSTVQIDLNIPAGLAGTLAWETPWAALANCTDTTEADCYVGFNVSGSSGMLQVATLTVATPSDCNGDFPIAFDTTDAFNIGDFGTGYNGVPADAVVDATIMCRDQTSVELATVEAETTTNQQFMIVLFAVVTLSGITLFTRHSAL